MTENGRSPPRRGGGLCQAGGRHLAVGLPHVVEAVDAQKTSPCLPRPTEASAAPTPCLQIAANAKTVAVLGCKTEAQASQPAFYVAEALHSMGVKIIPVLGERWLASSKGTALPSSAGDVDL